jgi:hypothetical protein
MKFLNCHNCFIMSAYTHNGTQILCSSMILPLHINKLFLCLIFLFILSFPSFPPYLLQFALLRVSFIEQREPRSCRTAESRFILSVPKASSQYQHCSNSYITDCVKRPSFCVPSLHRSYRGSTLPILSLEQ